MEKDKKTQKVSVNLNAAGFVTKNDFDKEMSKVATKKDLFFATIVLVIIIYIVGKP